jgi:hypothetical protein
MYSGSFIKKNPTMFVDTTWVNIDNLKVFLREREVSVYTNDSILIFFCELMKHLQEYARVKHVTNASIKEERADNLNMFLLR